MRQNDIRRGSTLGWVIIVMMVVMILLISALTISVSHTYRNQRTHSRRQAHITAVSVAQAFAEEVRSSSDKDGIQSVIKQLTDEDGAWKVRIEGLDSDMGEVDAELEVKKDLLIITIRVFLKQEVEQVILTIRQAALQEGGIQWEVLSYGEKNREEEVMP